MGDPCTNRIRKELTELAKEPNSGVRVAPVGDSLTHLEGSLDGPEDTPYAGGVWRVDIIVPRQYPFEPPKMKFLTPLWHPNVSSQTGAICLDILKESPGGAWSPALTLRTALMSLQALMCAPEPRDPQDAEVAKQYMSARGEWEVKARSWTQMYAGGKGGGAGGAGAGEAAAGGSGTGGGGSSSSSGGSGARAAAPAAMPPGTPPEWVGSVKSLIDMGFEGPRALAALKAARGNVQLAAERLLTGAV